MPADDTSLPKIATHYYAMGVSFGSAIASEISNLSGSFLNS